ncbi:heterokaryon incompatibility protein-domain-containing protein [Xylaria sp. FL1042]|nr:heterokaryon incompatibility protein-domain-containing protein [Xylaria sp. FL1042]
MEQRREYQYQPLYGPRTIRVLSLAPGKETDEVQCELRHVELGAESFEAISYAWGDPRKRRVIGCGSGMLSITDNLHSALIRLRREKEARVVWADAICINQKDMNERSQQVQVMADIYRLSRITFIWLGNETHELRNSFSSIKGARSSFPLAHPTTVNCKDKNFRETYHFDIFQVAKHFRYLFDWNPICSMLRLPWFGRKWVVQEVAMSNKVIVLCGLQSLSWNILEELIFYISIFEIPFDTGLPWKPVVSYAMGNIYVMTQARWYKEHQTISALLRNCRRFDCTDPRDHLFALLGIATDAAGESELLKSDYGLPMREVCRRFAVWSATVIGSLEFLSLGFEVDLDNDALSTWVPDFTRSSGENMVAMDSHFCASLDLCPRLNYHPKDQSLAITGLIVDTVKRVGSECRGSKPEHREMGKFTVELPREKMLWMVECGCMANDQPLGNMSPGRWEQFWRTLIWDNGFDPDRASAAESAIVFRFFIARCTLLLENHNEEWWEQYEKDQQACGNAHDLAFKTRRFCCTEESRLASVPGKTKVGDKICVLYGGKTPYVIRPHGNGRYKLVGICYLHGMMHGEALSMSFREEKLVFL